MDVTPIYFNMPPNKTMAKKGKININKKPYSRKIPINSIIFPQPMEVNYLHFLFLKQKKMEV